MFSVYSNLEGPLLFSTKLQQSQKKLGVLSHSLPPSQPSGLISLGISSIVSFETITKPNKFSKTAAKYPLCEFHKWI